MAYDFIVLGATGIQGRIASRDLLENGYSVLLAGRDKGQVESLLKRYKKSGWQYVDLRSMEDTYSVIKKSGANVVLNCAEGDWNVNAMKASMRAKAHYLDLGSEIWMTKIQFKMHNELKNKGLISITGVGSTPGVNNVMLAFAARRLDHVDSVEAGFAWDSNKKIFVVPFSIESVTEEFTIPATLVVDGKFVDVNPRDYFMTRRFRAVGKQRSFYVRHPEPYTFYQFLKNKGLKNIKFFASFPEHSYNKIVDLIDLKLGTDEIVNIEGKQIHTRHFLAQILKRLTIPKDYKEIENLWVEIKGRKNGDRKTILMECIAPTLKGWEDATCNIDTGMPAAIMAMMVKDGRITERGSFAPESVVPPEELFKELAKRGMTIYENGRKIN